MDERIEDLPERFRRNLGINSDGLSTHYVNELIAIIVADITFWNLLILYMYSRSYVRSFRREFGVIYGLGYSDEQRQEARENIPEKLRKFVPYKDFLINQAGRYNSYANMCGERQINSTDIIEMLFAQNKKAQEMDEIGKDLKAIGHSGFPINYESVTRLLFRGHVLIGGEQVAEQLKKRLPYFSGL